MRSWKLGVEGPLNWSSRGGGSAARGLYGLPSRASSEGAALMCRTGVLVTGYIHTFVCLKKNVCLPRPPAVRHDCIVQQWHV